MESLSYNQISEVETKNLISPYLESSVQFFYARGFSESDLIAEFGNLNNPNIVASADYLKRIELMHPDNNSNYRMEPDFYYCLLRAVGIDTVIELINGKVTKQLAKKAIRKIVGRTLCWVGAVYAMYEFGTCMEWY
ncbi:hypothetical protein [Zhouia amylolytica]|uniref:Uncharacterized protein n=1 Tax=Zhouia amylolytica AD3 TaxID=1286632 RepID=W2UJ34_9FLAO|nr:hypothetical protein [Zhouia amylolytica]ETN94165.1 hypothetical protein P278_29690 [Zhouia amylolytica AD3]